MNEWLLLILILIFLLFLCKRMGLFFFTAVQWVGCCHPKRDTTNRVTSSAKIPSPSFLPPSLSHKEKGEEGRGHGWMVRSVVVVVVVGGGGGGWWGGGMVRRKRGSGEEIFLWKKSPWVVDCYFLFVGLLWCCSHLGTDCEDLGCCCCWNKSWRGRKWVVGSNLVGGGGRGGEKEEENGRRIFWCMGCRIFGFFIEEFEA